MENKPRWFARFAMLGLFAGTTLLLADDKKPAAGTYPFAFRDVGDGAGVFPHLEGIRGHGAGWGDIDGDGWIDLYVATFHTEGAKANMLLRNDKGKFRLDEQAAPRISTRGTGV